MTKVYKLSLPVYIRKEFVFAQDIDEYQKYLDFAQHSFSEDSLSYDQPLLCQCHSLLCSEKKTQHRKDNKIKDDEKKLQRIEQILYKKN